MKHAAAFLLSKLPADWIVPFIIAALTAIGSVYMTNRHDALEAAQTTQSAQTELAGRVSALEAHRADDESKLDHIQAQVDRLVAWALGK